MSLRFIFFEGVPPDFFLACDILDDFGLGNELLQSFLDGSCWSRCWLCHGYGIFASVFFFLCRGNHDPQFQRIIDDVFDHWSLKIKFFFVHSGNQTGLEKSLISSNVRWVFPWNTGTPPLVEDVPSANCLIFHWLAEKSTIYRWVCQLIIMYNFQWIFQQTNRPWVLGPPADWCSHGHGHADADAAWEYDWTRPVLVSVIH